MSSAAVRATRTPPRGLALPGRTPGRPVLPPRLRVVTAPAAARSRAGLVIVCGTVLVAAMVAMLLLNVSLEQGAYELQKQQRATTTLTETRDALAEQLRVKSAPEVLAAQAQKLGMVPASGVAFLREGDPDVIGQPAAAQAAPSVPAATGPGVKPSPTAAASPTASATTGKATTGKATTGKATTGKATTGKTAATGAAPTKVSPSPRPTGATR